jgi:signal transduction histidine kinase/ligand-binding sensor domain-containing protein
MRQLPLVLLLAVVVVRPAVAGEPPALEGFDVSAWAGGNGVTLGAVRALAQDRTGYLWLGTANGLYRFDGARFVPLDAIVHTGTSVPRIPVFSLLVDRHDRVWLGLGEGGGLYVLDASRERVERRDQGLAGGINALAEGPDGAIWVGHDTGLLRLRDDRVEVVDAAGTLAGVRVAQVRLESDGIYVATPQGLFVMEPDGGAATRVALHGEDLVRASARDRRGHLWATDPLTGARTPAPATGESTSDGHPRPAARGSTMLRDSHGDLWLATIGQGLWRVGEAGLESRLSLTSGLRSDGVWALLEDREGNIWVGTHEGLNRLRRHVVSAYVDLGITASVAAAPDTSMWVAGSTGLIRFAAESGGGVSRRLIPGSGLRTVHVTAQGTVWAASPSGLFRLRAGQLEHVRDESGRPYLHVTTITSDPSGVVWFGDAAGVLRTWTPAHGATPVELPEADRGRRITLLRRTTDGSIWLGQQGGPLLELDTMRRWRRHDSHTGMVHESVLGFWEDARTGIWIVGSHGLSHLEGGHFVTIDRTHGLPSRRLTGVTGDRDGNLWLAHTNGILRLAPAEFNRVKSLTQAQVRTQGFDTSDGLAGVPTTLGTNSADTAPDGQLWFVTGRGMTRVSPDRLATRPRPSGPPRIESAVGDNVPLVPGSAAGLQAGVRTLRIDYTALDLTAPERLRFRYRLEGFDEGWQEAGTRREAFYTNLGPRDYRFRLQASRGDGVWQEADAPLAFFVEPRLYERPAFYAACLVLLVASVAGAWQWRLRRVRSQFALVLTERARLSRELHDTLLQSMVGVALKVDVLAGAAGAERSALLDVRRDIEDSIAEARRTIRNMRAGVSPVDTGDLITALEDAGARATAGSQVRFRLTVSGAPYRCTPAVESELLRIAQEALTNAIRHGRPTQVTAAVRFERSAITLRIGDDGCGFENTTRVSNHFGLTTMRERAEQLGGQFHLTTSTHGTEIEARIPVSTFG